MPVVEVDKLRWGDIYLNEHGQKCKHYPLHKYQALVYQSKARFTAAIAGTGGGKTVVGPLWLAKQIQEFRDRNGTRRTPFLGMVLAPTYKVLIRATVPALIDTFKGNKGLDGIYKQSDNVYVLPDNGGRIWCQGVDSPGGIEGGQFDAIWGDEAGQYKRTAWVAMQGRTGMKQAPILLTTTPYGKNYLYQDIYKKWLEGDPNYNVIQWPSTANPTYTIDEYNRAKASMGKERAAQRYDGQFIQAEGLVYPDFDKCIIEMSNDDLSSLLQRSGRMVGGIDFGWNDPFVAICGFLDAADDCLYIWYCRYKSQTPIEEHASALPSPFGRPVTWACDHDPEKTKLINQLRRGGHRAIPAVKSIIVGVDAINGRINTGRIKVIGSRCQPLVAEANNYRYPEKDEVIVGDKPDTGQDDHAMDALRYLVMQIDFKKAA